MTEGKCAIWGTSAQVTHKGINTIFNSARTGGKYISLSGMPLDNLSIQHKIKLTTWLIDQRLNGSDFPHIGTDVKKIFSHSNIELLSTSDRLERFFLYCSIFKNRIGDKIFLRNYGFLSYVSNITPEKENEDDILYAFTEIADLSEATIFANFLKEIGYLDLEFNLTYKAFEKIDQLKKTNISSKQVFVAMWFDPSLNDSYENAIEPAIREAGYEPRIIRKVEHNNKIDDEIIAEIRRSKFVIADFTCGFSKEGSEAIARGGVYYEAGFAQGLGLPVIWTCREDIISHVHFDTRQYNHIVWKDAADLKEKLLNRIRATIT